MILNALRLSGCGTQHPHRALGGTRVLLAAAPTTPPCFRRWRRSSSLRSGHIQRKNYFNFAFVATCGPLQTHFHGWGRKGRWHICPFPCALLCENQIQKRPQAFLHKNKNRGVQVVKLHVPFLFSLHAMRYQSHRMPRRRPQSKPCCSFLLKKRMEWRNWRLRSNESPSEAFKPQGGLAQARWSGLATTNLTSGIA